MKDINTRLGNTPIAIIGMGSIFPQARNLREYWNNIVGKVDCITDVPDTHWRIDDYYDPDPTTPDKTYCKRGGFLPDIDFDPMEFGLPPNILEVTDVSQMLSLLVAKEALTDAGYINASEDIRNRTGIVLGVGGGQKLIVPLSARLQYPVWKEALLSSGMSDTDADKIIEKIKLAYIRWEENSFPGMLGNVIAGRIANRFDLGGINCVTDAACASSMSALKLAISELLEHRADMMLTGGVDTDNSIVMYMNFSKTPAFTKGDHPRPFDAESDGMMVGEGIGIMVLKRLEDAERDGDRIYAVIKGIGASSDGRFKSIYAPRGEGQEKALSRAYQDAGIEPSTVGLFEAHGTGTVAGDATEVSTVIRFFNQHDPRKQHIALGSVKSQIGHTKASAGAAGLIKTALALHHKVLPPTLHVDNPNPKFNFPDSAFYVNSETRPWTQEGDTPRRAGVSSFGFGGTNFHVVLEEYVSDHQDAYRLHSGAQSIIFHAHTPAELSAQVQNALNLLKDTEAERHFLNFAQQSREAALPASAARLGFVAATPAEAITQLQAGADLLASKADAEEWTHPKGIYYRRSSLNLTGRVVALFSGQGAQYLEMGRELALNFPEMRDAFRQIDGHFTAAGKPTLSSVVFPPPAFTAEDKAAQETALQNTAYAQPAIGAITAGLYRILANAGFRADFAAGHSFGEVSALWGAGVLSDADYFRLVYARGAAMARPNDPNFDAGAMIAVSGDVAAIEREVTSLPGVQVANRNSNTQVVLAGGKAAVASAEAALKAKGYRTVALPVSAAFHTPLVGHAHQPFAQAIAAAAFHTPRIPVYANATGRAYPTDPAAAQQTLTDHMLQPVYFRDEVENLYAAGGYLFVEFGPRNILTNFVKDILGDRPHIAIALNGSRQKDSDRQMREAVVQLRVLGLPLGDVDRYQQTPQLPEAGKKGMKVALNGANYVSDKTRKAYHDALNDGFKVMPTAAPVPPTPVAAASLPVPQPQPQGSIFGDSRSDAAAASVPVPQPQPVVSPVTPAAPAPLVSIQDIMDQYRAHQDETRRAQDQYAQTQGEYLRIFFELTQQQHNLIASGSAHPQVIESITASLMRFHDHQAETLRLHEAYLREQTTTGQALLDLIRQQLSAGVVTGAAPRPAVTPPAASASQPQPIAPAQSPATVTAPAPVVTPVQPAALHPVAPTPAPTVVAAPPAPVVAPASSGVDVNALATAMLRIVSDKTGYPLEMLELNMDMEADLGIDSIKRVEILGAMRDEFPALPQFSPDELAELRTLGEIVDYMRAASGGTAAPAAVPDPAPLTSVQPTAPQPVAVQPVAPTPAPVVATLAPAAAPAASGPDVNALATAMLRIVSDKTGYPEDMLELSMDMEADLGIDSIKRVEILGAMRDEFPALPQFSPDELAELRTLGEIVDYMRAASGGTAAPAAVPDPAPVVTSVQPTAPQPVAVQPLAPTPAPVVTLPPAAAPAASGPDVNALATAMLRIVSDKTGYPEDMLELSMDMEADLGIDSIKRVEILGAMRDEFPALPQFSPDELAELRTLGEIVDYMRAASGGTAAPAAVPDPAPVVTPVQPTAPQPVAVQPVASPPAPVVTLAPAAATAASGPDVNALATAMLRIVSDKTGYPEDMLELSMDMEADLGIDSIKRVEILGAMRDEFPALPQFSPDELAELRTLGEIVDYMRAASGSASGTATNGHTAEITNAAAEVTTSPFLADTGIARSVVTLQPLPRPDFMDFAPSGVCVITDDGSAAAALLAQRMTREGWRVVALGLPSAPTAVNDQVARIAITDTSETGLQTLVNSITAQYGAISAFIHLNPANTVQNGLLFFNHEKETVKLIFLLAKFLKPQLTASAPGARRSFIVITRLDGAFGMASANGYGTIAGGLPGLVKTLNLEWNTVFCRAIDIAPTLTPEQVVDFICAELHDPNRLITEVGYGPQGRVTPVARQQHTNGVK